MVFSVMAKYIPYVEDYDSVISEVVPLTRRVRTAHIDRTSPPADTTDPLLHPLDTAFYRDYIVHRGRERLGRRRRADERWTVVKVLGEGGQGSVYLEKSESKPHLRAVKRIPQGSMNANSLDFQQELHALVQVKEASNF